MFGHGVDCAIGSTATDRAKLNKHMHPTVNARIRSVEIVQATIVFCCEIISRNQLKAEGNAIKLSASGPADATSVGEPSCSTGSTDHFPQDSSTWPSVSSSLRLTVRPRIIGLVSIRQDKNKVNTGSREPNGPPLVRRATMDQSVKPC